MKKISLLVFVVFVLCGLLSQIDASEAASKFKAPMNPQDMINVMLSVQPGTRLNDVIKKLGQPYSVKGTSHQWDLTPYDGQHYAGSVFLDLTIENKIVSRVMLNECLADEEDSNNRVGRIFRSLNEKLGQDSRYSYEDENRGDDMLWTVNEKIYFWAPLSYGYIGDKPFLHLFLTKRL